MKAFHPSNLVEVQPTFFWSPIYQRPKVTKNGNIIFLKNGRVYFLNDRGKQLSSSAIEKSFSTSMPLTNGTFTVAENKVVASIIGGRELKVYDQNGVLTERIGIPSDHGKIGSSLFQFADGTVAFTTTKNSIGFLDKRNELRMEGLPRDSLLSDVVFHENTLVVKSNTGSIVFESNGNKKGDISIPREPGVFLPNGCRLVREGSTLRVFNADGSPRSSALNLPDSRVLEPPVINEHEKTFAVSSGHEVLILDFDGIVRERYQLPKGWRDDASPKIFTNRANMGSDLSGLKRGSFPKLEDVPMLTAPTYLSGNRIAIGSYSGKIFIFNRFNESRP